MRRDVVIAVHVLVAAGRPLDDACAAALADVSTLGGTGGCIAVDRNGVVAAPHTTPAMAFGTRRHG